ncbi:phosphonate ABC transporter ATP-binding protein [Evansella halocellulosilytica]|uniref:phosphonate ABC transporter ATP-binding protein n=1 Tax=Evansella halocellulosilytica TaxID=2011013 RepID=UPI00211B7B97|nr:phosphonate ABC transporter ATP-binding protein [Evansella halocellulosilytica]
MMGELLKIEELKKVYGDGTEAIKSLSVTIKRGELVAVIGPSGAGKSTFLRCINRLEEPSSGKIVFNRTDIVTAKGRKLKEMRRQIGMIFQHFNLIKRVPAVKNVLHGRLGYTFWLRGGLGLFTENDTREALALLRKVGLEEHAFKRADELSGGQQQRVGIARALAQKPSLILADEPIASLDPSSSEKVMHDLKSISVEEGITTLINLHQVEIAKDFADRVIAINRGEIVFDGPPHTLTKTSIEQIYQ